MNSPTTTTPAVLTRLSAILALLLITFWANYESSKTFNISVINSAASTKPSRHFNLNFVSNGRATRTIYRTSQSVQSILYPNQTFLPRKPITHVTLQLSPHNLTTITAAAPGSYVISLFAASSNTGVIDSALRRAVARLWLWDGEGEAPEELVEGIVDFLVGGNDRRTVSVVTTRLWSAGFLKYCEGRRSGFVAELNRRMRGRWSELLAEEVMGASVRQVLEGYEVETGGMMREDM